MATTKKGKYHHGDLRKALIDASLSIIAAKGAEALTLRSAARAAGVSHAAPYAHFEDKDDLVAAVKDEGFKELAARMAAARSAHAADGPAPRVKAMATAYLRFATEQTAKYTVMYSRPLTPRPTFTYIETGRRIFQSLVDEVALMIAAKGDTTFDAHLLTTCAWSTMHGLCALWHDGPMTFIQPEGVSYDALAERFVAYIVRSVERV